MIRRRRRLLYSSSGAVVPPITYLFRDTFTTDDGPGSRTRTADGSGQWVIVDTASKITVTGGEAVLAATTAFNATAVGKDNGGNGFTRAPGLALIASGRFGGIEAFLYWTKSLTISDANAAYGIGYNGQALIRTLQNQVIPGTNAPNRTKTLWMSVLQSTGALMFWNGCLIWHDNTDTTATLYPLLSELSTTATFNLDEVAIVQLSQLDAAWGTNRAKATTYRATSVANQVEVMDANAIIRHSMLAATGVTQNLWVRRVDANNGWIIRFDPAGSTCKIIEIIAGVETERSSAALTQNNGTTYQIVVFCNGLLIKVLSLYTSVTSWANAVTNITATGLMVDRAGTELYAWSRDFTMPSAYARTKTILCVGDSKTFGTGDTVNTPGTEASGYPRYLIDLLGSGYCEFQVRNGINGRTTATLATNIASICAAFYGRVDYVLLNTSVNDLTGVAPGTLPAEATWKANYATILETLHLQFPEAIIVCVLMWKASATGVNGYGAAFDTLNGWVTDEIALHSGYCIVGPDERILIKGSDNGSTETADNIHPTNAVYQAYAPAFKLAMGL